MQNAKCKMQNGFKWLIGLMTLGLMMAIPAISQAIPGAKVLIVDNPNHKVIEVDPVTNNVVWEYGGTGTLNYPNEAIPLTNGNILIADTYNSRIIEVTSDTRQIVWQYPTAYSTTLLSRPVDVKKCIDYTTGTPRDTLLITDFGVNKVMEVTYPGGAVVWELGAIDIGGTGDYIFWEAEKRPGAGPPTCLITCRSNTNNQKVMEIVNPGSWTVRQSIWDYTNLTDPRDANWTPCGNVLITDPGTRTVIEVDPTTNNVVWQYGPYSGYIPLEAIRIENYNTLIAGVAPPNPWSWDDNKDGKYPPQGGGHNYTEVREIQGTSTFVWNYIRWGTGTPYGTGTESAFVDVEEKGIINIAKILYKDGGGHEMKKVFAGVVVPIYQPEIIAPPEIVATKTVTPTGPQRPGATLTYTIVVTNTGNGTATNVRIIDQIPEGTVYVVDSATVPPAVDNTEYSHNGGMNYDSLQTDPVTNIRWTINNLAPGASRTVNFSVVIR